MTEDEFKHKMLNALIIEVTPKIERLPHIKDGEVFKVIREIKSIKIVDFVAPEFELFKPHILLDFRFKIALDFVFYVGDMKNGTSAQQVSISNETYGTCRYIAEQEWFAFEYERVVF